MQTSEAGAIFVRMRTIKAEDLKAQGDGVDGRAAVRDDEVVMTPSKRPHKPGGKHSRKLRS